MTGHSLTSPSGAHRWMHCPGSVTLSQRVGPGPSSPEAELGTAAHEALTWVLSDDDRDSWELHGLTFNGHEADADMVDAVDVAVKECRRLITPATSVFLAQKLSHPRYPEMNGEVDFGTATTSLLNVVDYKHGEGVVVEVERNPQAMYYGFLMLQKYPTVERIVLRIIQPRAFHPDGPVRRWEILAKDLKAWARDELIPAMERTKESTEYNPGDWCRFCPAKLICPAIKKLATNAIVSVEDPALPGQLSNEELGLWYADAGPIRSFLRAIEDETAKRLGQGQAVAGAKLVARRSDRAWKDGAKGVFVDAFGDDAMEPPKLKSPAQMEKIGAKAKALVKAHAYTPDAGFTVALETDRRQAIKPPSAADVFSNYLAGDK